MVRTKRWIVLAGLSATIACGDSTGPDAICLPGTTFSATVSGALDGDITGCARFGHGVSVTGGSAPMNLTLLNGPDSGLDGMISLTAFGTRPAAGTYDVHGPQSSVSGGFTGFYQVGGPQGYTFQSGTVTINESSTETLAGSFSVIGVRSGSGDSVTITGTFTARCAHTTSIGC